MDFITMEHVLSACLGLGLAAACGFRIFVPFLAMSIAARAGHMELSQSFEWIGSSPALIVFSIATGLEIGAYFVPWLDNFLDSISTPTAVVAGVIATAAAVQDTSPLVTWTLAVIGGGGLAGIIQTATTLTRGASSMLTGGLGNPLVSAGEATGAVTVTAASFFVPVLTVVVVLLVVLFLTGRTLRRGFSSQPSPGRTA
jgi:hypothetical protein